MSAPTSGSAGGSPTPGFYPDPSIPGYIRYWNGAAWVPGTSRPAPAEGEPMPAPPPGTNAASPAPAAVEETGPVFLDEADPAGSGARAVRPHGDGQAPGASWDDPARLHGAGPEGATSWHADASRQSGFGEDARISWGAPGQAPAGTPAGGASWANLPPQRAAEGDPAAAGDAPAPAPDAPADGTVTIRAVNPAGRRGSGDQGTTAIRAVRPGNPPGKAPAGDQGTTAFRAVRPDAGEGGRPAPKNETMAFRLPADDRPTPGPAGGAPQSLPATGAPAAQQPAPQAAQSPAAQQPPVAPQQPAAPAPATGFPPQGGAAGDDGVIPWKPPSSDVFFAAAQAAQGHPAPLGRRLAARLIDTVVLALITLAVALPLWSTVTGHIDAKVEAAKQSGRQVTVYLVDGTTAPVFLAILAVVLIGGGLYEVLPTLKWGRTLGKKLCGVRVLDIESHDTPVLAQAIKRWLVYSVLGVLVIGVVNALWCVFDKPWRQCWHDKLARTFIASDAASD
ncbi:RDD family protein [Streptomyces sp. A1-5]|uniref:RDD family protein n=1 Tax=Streptomyces sp. A1-5 TaxID=2738410 RepID=UPI001F2DFDBA|nr:RDD family protein [Streptomyces sp. A1-5]UJB42233.1 RDD family protein [Streptomyces sp. A1-5]